MSRLQKGSTIPSVASTSQEYQENRALKVTFLSREWRSSTDGDFSTINRELAIQLAKHTNADVSILLPNCSEEDRISAKNHNVTLIEVHGIPDQMPVLWLSRFLRNHAIDCVIGHGVDIGQPISFIEANPNYSHCKWIQVFSSVSQVVRLFEYCDDICILYKHLEMVDQVITVGPKVGEAYRHHLDQVNHKKNVFDLTPSIFSEFLEVRQAAEEGKTFIILVIGSIDCSCIYFNIPEYEIAAKAIAELKDESYKLKFVYPDGGKGDIGTQNLLHYGISDNQLIVCSFDDSREVLADLFCTVDLAIMPSTIKCFGIKALAALSAGLPVLVNGNSGLGEALKEVPLGSHSVVDSEDPKDWAKEIKRVRQKERKVRLSESRFLREKYLERYSWEEPCKSLVIKMRNLVFASGSTEVKQEEGSGSAAQKHKLDPIGEPSKTRKFKVPMEGVMSQLVDVKMEPDTVQHLELKKDLLLDVKVIKRYVIFRGEVTEKGNVWNLPEAAAYVTFHEGAVPKPLLFTCSVWPPTLRSPPISSDELLVSNVIELLHDGPPELELSGDDKGNVTVALLHSASDLKGYEVVIKQLVDPYDNVWKDLETWHASEIPDVSDWPQLVKATCTLSQCSSFAAIWRLKSFTFTSRTSVAPQFTCVVPDFSDICVEVPLSSVPIDQDFTLTIKVQEFPSNEVEDFGIWCSPVIHISSSQDIVHMEPVTIKLPLTLRESKHDFSELSDEVIRILYLNSEGKPWSASWTDITGQLEGPVTIKGGIVEFKVKHFCRFCVCMINGSPVLLEDYFHGLSLRPMPQCVHFHTCLCKTTVPDTYGLLLYCYPNFKQAEVEKKLLSYDIPYKGEGKSKEPACVGDEIVVSPLALDFVRESPRNETIVLRFLGNEISEICDEALIVRTDSKTVPTVKFFKDKALQKLLCEVMILKTRPASLVQVPVIVDLDPRFSSCSTEVKQEEESGSASKKLKLVTSGEPETSRVSSANKTRKFKASCSTEVKQEEESGSAAKKLKLVTSGEPETSRVSSASKTRKFKVSDVEKEERDGEDGHKGRKSKETAIQEIKKISFVGKKRAREKSDQKAGASKNIPAKRPRTQPNKRMSSKENTGKEGVVSNDDLQTLGRDIGVKWGQLARRLPGIEEVDIEEIEDSYRTLSQKGFHMLRLWKTSNGEAANYKTLHDALVHSTVRRKDLAEKYCFE